RRTTFPSATPPPKTISHPRPAYYPGIMAGILGSRASSSVTLRDLPSYVMSIHDAAAVGIWLVGVKPPQPIKRIGVTNVSRRKSLDYYERIERGEIVINPMATSQLWITPGYEVSGGVRTGTRATLYNSDPVGPATKYGCGRDLWKLPTGALVAENNVPVSNTTTQNNLASLQAIYGLYSGADLSLVSQTTKYDWSTHTAAHLCAAIDNHISTLPRSNTMITSTVSDLRGGTYDVLTDLAEFAETYSYVMGCVVRILSEYTNVKKRISDKGKSINRKTKQAKAKGKQKTVKNRAPTKGEIDDAASEWLAYRYAMGPLILSINSAIEWFKTKDHEYQKYRGNFSHGPQTIKFGDFEVTIPVVNDRCFGKVRFDGPTAGLKLNPLSTALEKVPLSFLLNWVCNIGDVLTSYWPPSGAKQEVYTYSRQVPNSAVTATFRGKPVQLEYGYYRIDTIDPRDHIKLTLELNVSWKRMLDAFALTYGPVRKAVYKRANS
ncbi:MAG: hypothetical protein NWF07_09730, partial [Candidatus Bathyarchaeota archaeon]|nr:hypothetical protein [Candidatus Bathyarchaeota archaeon]